MDSKKASIQNMLEQNTANMIFYDSSFAKTAFFTKEIPNWEIPIFYLDFDLQHTGFVRAGMIPQPKNLTPICPENGSLYEDLKSVIVRILKTRSLVIIDSLNGVFNLLEDKKDVGRLVNSFLMLLISSAKHTKSTVIVGVLSKTNKENKWVLSNTGRHVIDNDNFTKTQLISSENKILVKTLNSDNSANSQLIL